MKSADLRPPLPATGRKLSASIEQATDELHSWARERLYDGLGDWPYGARLWLALLELSQPTADSGAAQMVRKRDLAAKCKLEVTEREWKRFLRFYDRHLRPRLVRVSAESGVPALAAWRVTGRGGNPDATEGIYYLCELAAFDASMDAARAAQTVHLTESRRETSPSSLPEPLRFESQQLGRHQGPEGAADEAAIDRCGEPPRLQRRAEEGQPRTGASAPRSGRDTHSRARSSDCGAEADEPPRPSGHHGAIDRRATASLLALLAVRETIVYVKRECGSAYVVPALMFGFVLVATQLNGISSEISVVTSTLSQIADWLSSAWAVRL